MQHLMKNAKKEKIKIKFQKMKGMYFFGQHPLVEKSPTSNDIYIFNYIEEEEVKSRGYISYVYRSGSLHREKKETRGGKVLN